MRLILCVLALVLSCTSVASAATVGVAGTDDPELGHQDTVFIDALPGEQNLMQLVIGPGSVTVTDRGAPPIAQDGCRAVDAATVQCPILAQRAPAETRVALGDQDDVLVIDASNTATVQADGGEGHDSLLGGGENDRFTGAAGNDTLAGAAGYDVLRGGEGADDLRGGDGPDELYGDDQAPFDDRLDGGEGFDQTSYADRTAPVSVDLVTGLGGQAGESDTISGVERVTGGDGPDVLLGDDGPNTLIGGQGGAGGDVIAGRGGDDAVQGRGDNEQMDGGDGNDALQGASGPSGTMVGGAGNDFLGGSEGMRFDAGPGQDRVLVNRQREHRPVQISCGEGPDEVEAPTIQVRLPADCETIGRSSDLRLSAQPQRTSRGLQLQAACGPQQVLPPGIVRARNCIGELVGRPVGSRTVIARRVLQPKPGQTVTYNLPLTKSARRLLARHAGRIVWTLPAPSGSTWIDAGR